MIRSIFQGNERRALTAALCAGLVAGVVVMAYGISQAAVGWGREVGFEPFDAVRVWSAAGVVGALPAALAALVGARLRAVDDRRPTARLLFWSAPLAAIAVSVGMTLGSAEPPWWLLPGGIGLLALIGWRRRLFWQAPADCAPTGWLVVVTGFLFTALQWGPPSSGSKAMLAFALVGLFLALGSSALGATQVALRRLTMPGTTVGLLTLAAGAVAAWLPWQLVDGYVTAKFIVVASLGFGAAHLAASAALGAQRPTPRALRASAVGFCMGTVLASAWVASLPVPDRFGSLARDSVVGLVWSAASAPHDADSDGHYAAEVGGNDPDDHRAALAPPAALPDTSAEPANSAALDAPPRTFDEPVDHVIIIIVDSLRADLLTDAETRGKFPHLNKLDAESARFERAYAPSNRTRLSLGPMLTGLAPEVFASIADRPDLYHRTLDKNWLGRAVEQREGERGRSALIFSTPFAWMLDGEFDLEADHRVIDPSTDKNGHTAGQFAAHFEKLIDAGFFDGAPTVTAAYIADPHAKHICADGREGDLDCYIDEVQLVDQALEHIYQSLDRAGVLERSLLIVTADHGRAFGELNYEGHATTLAEETIRVPLLMRLPDAGHRRVRAPVSLTALAATATDALHVEPVAPQLNASLLGHLAAGVDAPDDPVTVENMRGSKRPLPVHRTALIEDGRKLTYDWYTTHETLVDLEEELAPGSDLAEEEPEEAKKMVERLFDWREEALDLGQSSLPE